MIRLKDILLEQMTREKLQQLTQEKWLSHGNIERLLVADEGAALIANQFGETINTSKTPILSPMEGAWSKVWWLQSGKVLKISGNPDEYITAAYYSKRPAAQHVIGYYDVRDILFNGKPTDQFAMITDGVTVLNNMQKKTYHGLFMAGLIDPDPDRPFNITIEDINTGVITAEDWFGDTKNYTLPDKEFAKTLLSQRDSILKDIRRFQVDWTEAHSNNVGFDQYGQFVIFDIWSDDERQSKKGAIRRMSKSIDLLTLFKNFFDSTGTVG
jgi:hypothetical protein